MRAAVSTAKFGYSSNRCPISSTSTSFCRGARPRPSGSGVAPAGDLVPRGWLPCSASPCADMHVLRDAPCSNCSRCSPVERLPAGVGFGDVCDERLVMCGDVVEYRPVGGVVREHVGPVFPPDLHANDLVLFTAIAPAAKSAFSRRSPALRIRRSRNHRDRSSCRPRPVPWSAGAPRGRPLHCGSMLFSNASRSSMSSTFRMRR